jgi:hypothetical protein
MMQQIGFLHVDERLLPVGSRNQANHSLVVDQLISQRSHVVYVAGDFVGQCDPQP